MNKKYVGSMIAFKNQEYVMACCLITAKNKDEALGKALRSCRQKYSDGFYNHNVTCVLLEDLEDDLNKSYNK